jgi:DNA-binding response OmpR family regulator
MELKDLKILIVEDESIVALDIQSALDKVGVEVVLITSNYDEALKGVEEYSPDLVLMDINLHDSKDGIETAKAIQTIKELPVIFLTAFNDDKTISRAIELNPVGYLNKPFKREDLKSLIHIAFFKINQSKQKSLQKGLESLGYGYFFDIKSGELFFHEHHVKLSLKEKQLLRVLFESKGEIVSFETLEYKIWEEDTVSSSTLRTLIYRLRGKLEHKLIETIPKVGCRLKE